jgi:hypothetical protein
MLFTLVGCTGTATNEGDSTDFTGYDSHQGQKFPFFSLVGPKLVAAGHRVVVAAWDDGKVDWDSAEAVGCVVIGSVWGYESQMDKFRAWLQGLARVEGLCVLNPPEWLVFNMNKMYLRALPEAFRLPTVFLDPDEAEWSVAKCQAALGTTDIIAKGAVDANAFNYMHLKDLDDSKGFSALVDNNLKNQGGCLVQPFLKQVALHGEYSFVFFGGQLSHSFLKLTGGKDKERVQCLWGGKSFHVKVTSGKLDRSHFQEVVKGPIAAFRADLDVSFDEYDSAIAQAQAVMDQIPGILGKQTPPVPVPFLLRVDGVLVDGVLRIMELEGIEPYAEMAEQMVCDPDNDVVGIFCDNLVTRAAANK